MFDIWKVEFNPNCNEILTGQVSLKIFDISSGELTKESLKGTRAIQSLAYSPNGSMLAYGNIDGVVQILDTKNYDNIEIFQNHGKAVRALQFSQNN